MADFIPIPRVVRATLSFVLAGVTVSFSLDFETDSVPTEADADAVAAMVAGWYDGWLKNCLSNQIALTNIRVVSLASNEGVAKDYPIANVVGTQAVASETNNVALAVSKKSAIRGRSNNGRFFIAGIPENFTADSRVLTAGGAVQLAASMGALLSTAAAQSYPMVISSRYNDGVARTTGIRNEVKTLGFNARLDTQRRRMGD